jgi:hypothetical protein
MDAVEKIRNTSLLIIEPFFLGPPAHSLIAVI